MQGVAGNLADVVDMRGQMIQGDLLARIACLPVAKQEPVVRYHAHHAVTFDQAADGGIAEMPFAVRALHEAARVGVRSDYRAVKTVQGFEG